MTEMKVTRSIESAKRICREWARSGKRIGLVPTMGALHEGHLSLIRQARRDNDRVVVSIFVNPTQFSPGEDYARYPRSGQRDRALARQAGVDMVFEPKAAGMYPRGFQTSVEVGRLAKHLCGLTRPRLFGGVCVVVAKLFEIVRPDIAYFGQKDYQQFVILRQMVRDLNMDVRLKMLPIVRDRDGLALSSRNQYLSGHQRKLALFLYRALRAGRSAIKKRKIKDVRTVEKVMRSTIPQPRASGIRVEYLQVCNPDTLDRPRKITGPVLLAGALWVGKTRLIDNILVR